MRHVVLTLMFCSMSAAGADPHHVTKADVDRWMKELSNWGRWGKDDQIGTVNLITAAKRQGAAALVKEGVPVSMARDTEKQKAVDNGSPFKQVVSWTEKNGPAQYELDEYSVSYHGYAHTHMDALCHLFIDGKAYNGVPKSSITAAGASKLAVLNFKNGIFSRAILMDIPRLKGVAYLEPDVAIYPEDLDAWEKKGGVKVESGDVVFIRTGRWARRAAKGPWDVGARSAGLHASCAKWLKDRDVAMVGSDAATDLMPSRVEGVAQPLHQLLLVAMGTPIFDNCDLEAVSEAANSRKRWAFLVTAAPMAVVGGSGSPLNPIATF